MGREYELKYRASDEQLEAVRQSFGDFTEIRMETVYYDGPGSPLGELRWTLRRRMENETSVCTLKTGLRDGSRGEWEVHCGDIAAAVPMLIAAGAPEELAELTAQGVAPVCGARFVRLAKRVPVDGGEVELALDWGVLTGGGRELPFREIEAELKTGPDTAADDFAAVLSSRFGLEPEPLSKFRRALTLAQDAEEAR